MQQIRALPLTLTLIRPTSQGKPNLTQETVYFTRQKRRDREEGKQRFAH